MNPNDAFKLLETYTLWLNKRWGLPDYEPVTPLIRNFLDNERLAEIKTEEAHQVIFCPHIGVDKTPVHYQYRLGKHDLRVCHACYDNIRAELLDDLISTALKELFQEWRESKRKSTPHPDSFIG